MAYAQWVSVSIINRVKSGVITVQDAKILWGKFYVGDNKNNEVSEDEVNNITVAPGGLPGKVSAVGRSDEAAGAEGRFSLYLGGQKICGIYFNCPWGKKLNEFRLEDYRPAADAPYNVILPTINRDSGALGNVEVLVLDK